jgi:hypothetical protein
MEHLEDESTSSAKLEEVLKLIKFGPDLTHSERDELESLVIKYAELFITKHRDLPNIILEEHQIELKEDFKPIREKQRRMAPDRAAILKAELDRLLEGGFITQVKNT